MKQKSSTISKIQQQRNIEWAVSLNKFSNCCKYSQDEKFNQLKKSNIFNRKKPYRCQKVFNKLMAIENSKYDFIAENYLKLRGELNK